MKKMFTAIVSAAAALAGPASIDTLLPQTDSVHASAADDIWE
jgi:hypothetical protein